MATTYTVVKGDNLTKIAAKYNTTIDALVKLNNIPNRDLIYIGQVLKIDGEAEAEKKNTTSSIPIITHFGLLAGDGQDREVYAKWSWDKSKTDHYEAVWEYHVGNTDAGWLVGSKTNVDSDIKHATYSAPANAIAVRLRIRAVAIGTTKNNVTTYPWGNSNGQSGYSSQKTYYFKNNPPATPDTPDVEIEGTKLTATLSNIDSNATHIEFQVVRDDKKVYTFGSAAITTTSVTWTCLIVAGSEYKVRCRAVRGKLYSDWSPYSGNEATIPSNVGGAPTCSATSATSVYIEWKAVSNATSYDLQYTTEKRYFEGSDQVSVENNIESNHFEKTGLTSGEEYFFRVRAVNDEGFSSWSSIGSIIIGKPPAAPTTWSSTTTAITGEDLTLYWVHNAEDDSKQTYAELELYIDGRYESHTIQSTTAEDEEEKTSEYVINTLGFVEGVQILWRVRTAGITKEYGDWSVQRTVDIYAPPTLEMEIIDGTGTVIETLEHFPFYISALAGPNTQQPIGYHVSVTANSTHETVDGIGNPIIVKAGQEVYSKHFDINDPLMIELSANNIHLENNIAYTVTCTVSMNSGLTAEATGTFEVAWIDLLFMPNSEIGVNYDDYSVYLTPYCINEDEALCENVTLSVYRREFDGTFTELITEIPNTQTTSIVDPHPALDYARYRIVAKSTTTGAVSFYDMVSESVGGKEIVIQWDEDWSTFEVPEDPEDAEKELVEPPWAGSLLKLPYNIDISNSYKNDVKLVDYIGRKYSVSYYGTKFSETSTWNTDVPMDDEETIYQLRRLAAWQGDVYVREPHGTGYWANVSISFNENHLETTVPVSISITRVEGGA